MPPTGVGPGDSADAGLEDGLLVPEGKGDGDRTGEPFGVGRGLAPGWVAVGDGVGLGVGVGVGAGVGVGVGVGRGRITNGLSGTNGGPSG